MLTRTLLKHAGITLASISMLVLIPVFSHFSPSIGEAEVDAESGASIELPDTPSGNFYILLKESFVKDDSMTDWKSFFLADENETLPVLFDNVHCIVAEGDVFAQQLAERYQAILSPNQMKISSEDPTLFISKAETGHMEMAILSADMAKALEFSSEQKIDSIELLTVSGD